MEVRLIIMIYTFMYSSSVLAEVKTRFYETVDHGIFIDLIINLFAAILGGIGSAIFKTKNPNNITKVKSTLKQDLFLSALAGLMFYFWSLSYLDEASTQLVLVMVAGWAGGSGIEWIVEAVKGYIIHNTIHKDPTIYRENINYKEDEVEEELVLDENKLDDSDDKSDGR